MENLPVYTFQTISKKWKPSEMVFSEKECIFMALSGNPFRVDIADEAIIGYEAHAIATNDERVKEILYHIADKERKMSEKC